MSLAPMPTRTLRHANVEDLIRTLEHQHRQKVDRVVSVRSGIRLLNGNVEVAGMDDISVPPVEEDITEYGVTPGQPGYTVDVNGAYLPTAVADGQLAQLFKIPVQYLRRLREENIDLLDANVNMWAPRGVRLESGTYDPDKKVLLRLLWGDDGTDTTVGVCRAILSDRYGARDNLDTAMAVLDGMTAAGLGAQHIIGADLSDNRFYLYVAAPEVNALAPVLLDGYSPYRRMSTIDLPRVHCGFAVTNSETGGGALAITPRIVVEWCKNGMQIPKEALRKVHLGTKLDEGNVLWSARTRDAANELTRSQVIDAVHSFLSPEFLNHQIEVLQRDCTTEIDPQHVTDTIENVGAKLQYTKSERNGILAHFIKGGQLTSGGVLHAVTSYSQQIESPDRSWDVESSAVEAMHLAARLQVSTTTTVSVTR